MQGSSSTSSFKPLIFKTALFLAVILPFFMFTGVIYEKASTKNKINEWSRKRFEEFYALPKNSIDLLFIGSSHSYCTFDPEVFDEYAGVSSYQLGMPEQYADTSYYTLLDTLNYQQPEAVVMEIYWGVLDKPFNHKQADSLFQALSNKPLETQYKEQVFPLNEKIKYGLKPIRFQQDFIAYLNNRLINKIRNDYGFSHLKEIQEGEEYYRSKGYIYCDYIMTPEQYKKIKQGIGFNGGKWSLDKTQKEYLEKIIRLCAEKEIALFWVTAPVSNIYFSKITEYENIHNSVSTLAEKNGIPYMDFNMINKEENLFSDDVFRDGAHLNDNGAKVATKYFAEYYKKK